MQRTPAVGGAGGHALPSSVALRSPANDPKDDQLVSTPRSAHHPSQWGEIRPLPPTPNQGRAKVGGAGGETVLESRVI